MDGQVFTSLEDEAGFLFERGRHAESNAALLAMVPAVYDTSYLNFMIGRNFLYLGELDEAGRYLDRAIAKDAPFHWSYYELARLEALKQDYPAAVAACLRFLECELALQPEAKLNPAHYDVLVDIAHRCFDVDRNVAMKLYRVLGRLEVRNYLTQLRYAEDMLDHTLGAEAEAVLARLNEWHRLDRWGLFALGKARALQGDHEGARTVLLQTLDDGQSDPFTVVTAAHRLAESKYFDEALDVLNRYASLETGSPPDPRFIGAHFRLAALKRDHDRLAALYRRFPDIHETLERWVIVEALFEVALPGDQITPPDIEFTTGLATFLEQNNEAFDLASCLALYHFYARRRLWDSADALTAKLAGSAIATHPEILLRQFEFLCLRHDLQAADEFLNRFLAGRELGQWELTSVMRFYAEAKRWPDAARVLREFIGRGFLFPKGEFFILQICRKTGCHRDVLAALLSAGHGARRDAALLRQNIVDDLAIWEGKSPVIVSVAGEEQSLFASPENAVLLPVEANLDGGPGPVYFTCADRGYFFSVLTLLASFSMHGPGRRWFVFADRAIPEDWIAASRAMTRRLGMQVAFVREQDFITTDLVLHDTYGIFTGGNTLSRAAFFRIYAARYLAAMGAAARCIYLDSDIVLAADPREFEMLAFDGACLLARTEEFSPEIRDAAVKNGLLPETYFNSGVLQFDLRDPDLTGLLAEAVQLSETAPERLIFHDQCALNIAFKDRTGALPAKYNYFLRPARPDNGDPACAVLAHFLDKPKPWDVTYQRDYRSLWLPHARMVRMLMPGDIYQKIVAASAGAQS